MKLRNLLFIGVGIIAGFAAPALADLTYTQGSGTTIFDFVCFTTKHCSAHVNIKSDGTEIFSVSNPGQVTVANTLTAVGNNADGVAAAAGAASPVVNYNYVWNGATWDRQQPSTAIFDPCQNTAKTTLPITLATAAVKVIATGVSAKKIYVCQINLNNNAADTVAIFEATTATTCATSAVAVVGAGTSVASAGTGYNFAATGGISIGNGANQVLQTATNANDLCIAQSAATQLTGSITYVTR